MRSIGIRELRQNASLYLRLVRAGEVIEVTDRGEPIAHLTPVPDESPLERMRREGRIRPAKKSASTLPMPVESEPGTTTLSAALIEARADERF